MTSPDPLSLNKTTHTIFCTDKLKTEYPDYFVNSSNQKYVSVIACHVFYDDPTIEEDIEQFSVPQYYRLHASFVQDAECLDRYVCMANQPLYHKRKYKQYNSAKIFDIWFTDYQDVPVTMNENFHFVLELLLEY